MLRMRKRNQKRVLEIMVVALLAAFTAVVAFYSMRLGRYVSLVIFGLGGIPILLAYVLKIDLKKMLPDIIFGIIDNLILIVPAILGAELFGAAGALASLD